MKNKGGVIVNLTLEDLETTTAINNFKEQKGEEFPDALILADLLLDIQSKVIELENFSGEQKEQTAQLILHQVSEVTPYLVTALLTSSDLLKESINYLDFFTTVVDTHNPELKHRLEQHGDLVYRYLNALKLAGKDERRVKKGIAKALYTGKE